MSTPQPPGEIVPFPHSLCHRCADHRLVHSARAVYILCSALPNKYPRQPVAPGCPGFSPAPGSAPA